MNLTRHKDLNELLARRSFNLPDWAIGKIPKHYKRLSVDEGEAVELAKAGFAKIYSYFGIKLFFSQSLMAGAIFSGKYDDFVIVTPSQYGKSYLMGMIAIIKAYEGRKVYVAASTGDTTKVIMGHVGNHLQTVAPEVRQKLLEKKDKIEKLATSTSKGKISFSTGGMVEAITLGETYSTANNQVIGRGGGDYIVDEAGKCSEDALAEMGRREFASITGEKFQSIMISNPHQPGLFYDKLTEDEPPEGRFILWMDALTAIEEDRLKESIVINSDFARNRITRMKYIHCILELTDSSMFEKPIVYEGSFSSDYTQYFMGIDSAYKGRDSITCALNAVDENGISHIEWIKTIDKGDNDWDGVIKELGRLARIYRCAYITVDEGWGVWILRGLENMGLPVKGINFGSSPTKARQSVKHYAALWASNKRAEMHLDLQDLMEHQAIEFSESAYQKIKDILPLVSTKTRRGSGKIDIIPKTQIKALLGRSPDELDSVILAVHAAILFGGE